MPRNSLYPAARLPFHGGGDARPGVFQKSWETFREARRHGFTAILKGPALPRVNRAVNRVKRHQATRLCIVTTSQVTNYGGFAAARTP